MEEEGDSHHYSTFECARARDGMDSSLAGEVKYINLCVLDGVKIMCKVPHTFGAQGVGHRYQ